MQTDCSLVELARIVDPVYWLQGIDGTGMRRIHLYRIRSLQVAPAFFQVLDDHAIVLDQQSPMGTAIQQF